MSTRWTEADVARHQAKLGRLALEEQAVEKPSKYRNVPVVVDGIRFSSKREAQHWQELKIRERAGDISNLRRQVPYDLRCPIDYNFEGQAVVATYLADFVYVDKQGRTHVVDIKGGKNTPMFQLKKRWLALQSSIEIEEIRG